MTEEHNQVIEKMKQGWELADRGTGYWLTKPRKPYEQICQVKIDDDIIKVIESEGLITLELPAMVIYGKLTDVTTSTLEKQQ